jgi:hypothetical protein
MERKILIANDGMVLTNGEIYGKEIYLADGMSADAFHEITQAEYDEIMAQEETDVLVENEDMRTALNLLGVE